MMADALRRARVLPPLYPALSIHLVEINPVLRENRRRRWRAREASSARQHRRGCPRTW